MNIHVESLFNIPPEFLLIQLNNMDLAGAVVEDSPPEQTVKDAVVTGYVHGFPISVGWEPKAIWCCGGHTTLGNYRPKKNVALPAFPNFPVWNIKRQVTYLLTYMYCYLPPHSWFM